MPRKKCVGIISSVPFEADYLLNSLERRNEISREVTTGRIGKVPCVHITSGIGLTNAAYAATVLSERYSPRIIILMGIGGAYPRSGIGIEDVVMAEREIYADLGVPTCNGICDIKKIGIPLLKRNSKKYYNEFTLDRGLIRQSRKGLLHLNLKTGVFLTVSRITVTRNRALKLRNAFNAICENMEGAAVAHISVRYGIPVIEIRGISNVVGERDMAKWRKETAAVKCQKAVIELLNIL